MYNIFLDLKINFLLKSDGAWAVTHEIPLYLYCQ